MADPKEKPAAKPPEAPAPVPQGTPVEQKPLPPAVSQSLAEGQQALGALREEVGMPKPKASPFKPEQPVAAPGGPQAKPPGVPGQPGTPAGVTPPEKPKDDKKSLVPTKTELENMSMGDLMSGMMESFGNMMESFKSFGDNFLGKLQKKVGEKFTDDEVKKIQVDLEKAKDKIYPTQDRATEYVTTVLNLPVRPDAQKFLNSLQASGLVFEQDIGKLKELQVGDVLFFQKPEKKGVAYLTAVISKTEPLTMRTIPRSGGAPQDINLMQSDYFKNEWLGFVRLPRKPNAAPPPALATPGDSKDQKPATPGVKPASGSPDKPAAQPGAAAPVKPDSGTVPGAPSGSPSGT